MSVGGRRARGEGGVYQRKDGRWCGSVDFGLVGGKRRRKIVYGRTKKEAAEKLYEARKEADAGRLVLPAKVTLGEYLDHWLEHVARPQIRDTTHDSYETAIRNHVKPRVGNLQLAKLNVLGMQRLYRELERDGVRLRPRQLVHIVLRKALGDAVKAGILGRNPAVDVGRPKRSRRDPDGKGGRAREIRALTPAQVLKLLAEVQGDPFEPVYVLAVTAGLRISEIFGLQWGDVDLERGVLSVRRAAVELRGKVNVEEPKTEKSRRSIDLPKTAIEALERRREIVGDASAGSWIFPDAKGSPLRRSNFQNRHWRKLRARLGLDDVRFHDLRHTHATMMLRAGVHPKVVQERLGHSSIVMTLDTYSWVLQGMQREAADRIEGLLGEGADEARE